VSTILKALRRLESEKVVESSERPLREELADSPPARPRRSRSDLWIPALALAAGLGIGATAFWLWPGETTPPDVAMAAEGDASPAAVAPAPTPRVAAPPIAAPPAPIVNLRPAPAVSDSVEVVPRPPKELLIAAEPPAPSAPAPVAAEPAPVPVAKPAPPAPAPAPAPPTQVARATPAPKPKAKPAPRVAAPAPVPDSELPIAKTYPLAASTPEPAPVEAARVEPVAPAPVEAARVEPVAPAPRVMTEPPAPAPRVMTEPPAPAMASPLHVAKTFWHPTRNRREAMIALGEAPAARVREGDEIGGFTVAEIQPGAVMFERDGERIRRALGAK
jgi:hypothetical protein